MLVDYQARDIFQCLKLVNAKMKLRINKIQKIYWRHI